MYPFTLQMRTLLQAPSTLRSKALHMKPINYYAIWLRLHKKRRPIIFNIFYSDYLSLKCQVNNENSNYWIHHKT